MPSVKIAAFIRLKLFENFLDTKKYRFVFDENTLRNTFFFLYWLFLRPLVAFSVRDDWKCQESYAGAVKGCYKLTKEEYITQKVKGIHYINQLLLLVCVFSVVFYIHCIL